MQQHCSFTYRWRLTCYWNAKKKAIAWPLFNLENYGLGPQRLLKQRDVLLKSLYQTRQVSGHVCVFVLSILPISMIFRLEFATFLTGVVYIYRYMYYLIVKFYVFHIVFFIFNYFCSPIIVNIKKCYTNKCI